MPMTDQAVRRLRATLMSCAMLVAGCTTTDPPATSTAAAQEPSPLATFCGDFTPPPFGALRPIAGISIRSIDKTHFEIRNATDRRYYFTGFFWTIEENLVCGRGVVSREGANGPLDPGSTVVIDGGSTPATPMTVSVWDAPCGEGCHRPPIGQYVVPLSPAEPPVPGRT